MADLRMITVLAALALLCISTVEGQKNQMKKCYQCFGLGSTSPLLATTASQYPISQCSDIGPQTETIDCNPGNCYTQNFTVSYVFQQGVYQPIEVDYLILGCGAKNPGNVNNPKIGCQDFNSLPNIEEVRQQTANVVAQYGGQVMNMRGNACFCPNNMCNNNSAAPPSPGAKAAGMALLLASLAMLKTVFML